MAAKPKVAATPAKALEYARLAVEYDIGVHIAEYVLKAAAPPEPVQEVFKVTFAVLKEKHGSWEEMPKDLKKLVGGILAFDPQRDDQKRVVGILEPFLGQEAFFPECLRHFSPVCEILCRWCRAVYAVCGGSRAFDEASQDALDAAQESANNFHYLMNPLMKPRASVTRHEGDGHLTASLEVSFAGAEGTLYLGAQPSWTWVEINNALDNCGEELPKHREAGKRWQFIQKGQPMGRYQCLDELGMDDGDDEEDEESEGAYRLTAQLENFTAVSALDPETAKRDAAGLDSLSKASVTELKAFAKPPLHVHMTCRAVAVILGFGDSWKDAKKMLADPTFLSRCVKVDPASIPEDALIRLQWYAENPELEPEKIMKASYAASSLACWYRAVYALALMSRQR